MFYSQVILTRKGPLGKIWLAAHYDKKLTKAQIFTTDISDSVDSVLNPAAPLALRVSGHLMLGIVRIYSRKVKYLMTDCTEAMWKMKLAFKPGAVDIPEGQVTAAIDDARFFGNVSMDPDFPELLDVAFPISQTLRSKSESDDIQISESYHEDWSRPVSSISGRVSDIELARREQIRIPSASSLGVSGAGIGTASTSLLPRTSVASSLQRSRESMTMASKMDEDIPAFEDHDEILFETPALVQEDTRMDIVEPIPDYNVSLTLPLSLPSPEDGMVEEEKIDTKPREKKRRKVKKGVTVMDERVEISSRFIKNLMTDRSSLLRRNPTDPLLPCPKDYVIDMGPSISGLCRELTETLNMTMSLRGLPFRSRLPMEESSPHVELTRRQEISQISIPREDTFDMQPDQDFSHYEEKKYDEEDKRDREEEDYDYAYQPPTYTDEIEPQVYDEGKSFENVLPARYEHIGKENWNKRTKQVLGILQEQFTTATITTATTSRYENQSVSFQSLSAGVTKKTAALTFFEILQLKTWDYIEVDQKSPFSEIYITPTEACWA